MSDTTDMQLASDNDLIHVDDGKITDLVQQFNKAYDTANKLINISSRKGPPNLGEMVVMDDDKMRTIQERMPEIDRATKFFGKQNSQSTATMMTMLMLVESPYHALKQALAQLENKRSAIKSNTYNITKGMNNIKRLINKKQKIKHEISKLEAKLDNLGTDDDPDEIQFKINDLNCDLEDIVIELSQAYTGMKDGQTYMEAAVKEVAMYQELYEEIRKNHNIPEDWDEVDFEKAEIESHVKTAMLHVLRDVMVHSKIGMGTIEYVERYGIHPYTAVNFTQQYLNGIEEGIKREVAQGLQMLDQYKNALVNLFNEYGAKLESKLTVSAAELFETGLSPEKQQALQEVINIIITSKDSDKFKDIDMHIKELTNKYVINKPLGPDYNHMVNEFLEKAWQVFGNEYHKALDHVGVKSYIRPWISDVQREENKKLLEEYVSPYSDDYEGIQRQLTQQTSAGAANEA